MKKTITSISIFTFILSTNLSWSQCAISGITTPACESGPIQTLSTSGTLILGPGMSGSDFDPSLAGPGMTTLNVYDFTTPNFYTVDQTGVFAPLASPGGIAVTLSDDEVSGTLPIGFSFNFFGTIYTDFYISSNGFISFDGLVSQGCCSGDLIPTFDGVDNVIAWGWNDLYPPIGGSITYETVGVAPNRKLLVTFTALDHCCSDGPTNTSQTILYETSNVIEIHTTEITNDGSTCTQGIENFDGTLAFGDPSRNSTNFTLTNDYIAFIPGFLCTSTMIDVVPNSTGVDAASFCEGTTYNFGTQNLTAGGVYVEPFTSLITGCDSLVTLTLTMIPAPVISIVTNIDEIAGNDGSIDISIGGGSAYAYLWSNGAITEDVTGLPGGPYAIVVTDLVTSCATSQNITVNSQLGVVPLIEDMFVIYPNPSNGIFNLTVSKMESDMHLNIINSLGQSVLSKKIDNMKTEVNISNVPSGTYFVRMNSNSGNSIQKIVIKK